MPPTFQFQFLVPLNQLVDQLSCQKSFGTLFKLGVKIYNYQSCLETNTIVDYYIKQMQSEKRSESYVVAWAPITFT